MYFIILVPLQHTGMYLVYIILKAPVSTVSTVSTVVPRYLFTNNHLQLFQINPLHVYRWPNGV
jgi:hypothetical protein